MAKITVTDLLAKKRAGLSIVALTCYDYPTALIEDQVGVDVQLVGDSVGTNVLGYASVAEVTVDDMIHHVSAVARGAGRSFVLGDMPSGSFDRRETALDNARRMLAAGADGVKMEGEESVVDIVAHVARAGAPVCAHIGYTPQTQSRAAVQGKDLDRALQLLDVARKLESAGAFMIVLELLPEELAREVTASVSIPTIGIGAGRYCDGQVQVVNDVLGLSARQFRHSRKYADLAGVVGDAVAAYGRDVRERAFPTSDHASHLSDEVAALVRARRG